MKTGTSGHPLNYLSNNHLFNSSTINSKHDVVDWCSKTQQPVTSVWPLTFLCMTFDLPLYDLWPSSVWPLTFLHPLLQMFRPVHQPSLSCTAPDQRCWLAGEPRPITEETLCAATTWTRGRNPRVPGERSTSNPLKRECTRWAENSRMIYQQVLWACGWSENSFCDLHNYDKTCLNQSDILFIAQYFTASHARKSLTCSSAFV